MYAFEEKLLLNGVSCIAGVDEAGRGPLAGPVVAGAVILPKHERIEGINDSKKLSEKKREVLFLEITQKCYVGVGVVDEPTIDKINIYQASRLAMKFAVENLRVKPDFLLIDGNMTVELPIKSNSIVKGDSLSASIAAASIVAKVTRDRIMLDLHEIYPEYGFDKHKGYPTKAHVEVLERIGSVKIHRKTFGPVKRVLNCE